MRHLRITYTLTVDDNASEADIDLMVGSAGVQLSEPANEDGDDAGFSTSNLTSEWVQVPAPPVPDPTRCEHGVRLASLNPCTQCNPEPLPWLAPAGVDMPPLPTEAEARKAYAGHYWHEREHHLRDLARVLAWQSLTTAEQHALGGTPPPMTEPQEASP